MISSTAKHAAFIAGAVLVVSTVSGCGGGGDQDKPNVAEQALSNDAKAAARLKADAERTVNESAAANRAAEAERVEAQRAAEEKAAEQRAAEQRAAEQRAAEQRAAEQRAAEQRAAEQRAAEQRAAEQRAAEQRAAEQRAAEQRAAEENAAAEKALAEQHARAFTEGRSALFKKYLELTGASADDVPRRQRMGTLPDRIRKLREQVDAIVSEPTPIGDAPRAALLRRSQEALRQIEALLLERQQWIDGEPERQAEETRRENERLDEIQRKKDLETQRQKDLDAQREKDLEAQREKDLEAQRQRDLKEQERQKELAAQEEDYCNPLPTSTSIANASPVTAAALAAATDSVDQIVVKLRSSPREGVHSSDTSHVMAVLRRALARLASTKEYVGGSLSRSSDQDAVRVLRMMSDGAVVVSLAKAVPRDEAESLLRYLQGDAEVAYAEPDSIMDGLSITTHGAVDSEGYDPLWHLKRIRSEQALASFASADDAIRKSVVTAIIDSGWVSHAALIASQYRGGVNLAFYRGESMTAEQTGNVGMGEAGKERNLSSVWHGTSVAGMVGASRPPAGKTVTFGVNPGSRLLPVRVFMPQGGTRTSDVIDGIRWSAGKPVDSIAPPQVNIKVINLSLGGVLPHSLDRKGGKCSTSMQDAIDYAIGRGITVVTAAGNDNAPSSWTAPANCKGVINVGGTDPHDERFGAKNGNRYSGSAYGDAVTISAPGGDVTAITLANEYTYDPHFGNGQGLGIRRPTPGSESEIRADGTSLAAPQVSGIVTLMLAANPALKPEQIKKILIDTADKSKQHLDRCLRPPGAGIVDAAAAVEKARASVGA